jgi:hypothetical protein
MKRGDTRNPDEVEWHDMSMPLHRINRVLPGRIRVLSVFGPGERGWLPLHC